MSGGSGAGAGRPGDPVGGRVVVRVPATSANLGPGFDALGLALGVWDTYTVSAAVAATAPCTVRVEGEGSGTVARDEGNLVVAAMRAAAAAAGARLPRFALHCDNRVPHGRGLGSSAAAIVGGVLAGRALAGLPRDRPAELAVAAALEGHPDNVAAALLGGLTVAWCARAEGGDLDSAGPGTPAPPAPSAPIAHAIGLTPVPLRIRAFVPPAAMSTRTARGLLPARVPHVDAAHAAGRSALLVAALTVPGLPDRRGALLAGTEDRLHQAVRGALMPASRDLLARLRAAGVAAVLSGSGPTVLAITPAGVDGDGGVDPHGDRDVDADGSARAGGRLPPGWTVLDVEVAGGATCLVTAGALAVG